MAGSVKYIENNNNILVCFLLTFITLKYLHYIERETKATCLFTYTWGKMTRSYVFPFSLNKVEERSDNESYVDRLRDQSMNMYFKDDKDK